ncbi:tRNA (guanine(37)-N1)-methyltransferase [Melanaphis sacchari]|uniref:tRNA (guanine(37)-N1)-methyltransferase n=1 Tax=Melanaphis sacchari TaxID=742174 RepID=A0A2H8U076_9HEMI|nr:tRNA (guanine(37)-N1)-methyltransferase [Melanaphis sacchari]
MNLTCRQSLRHFISKYIRSNKTIMNALLPPDEVRGMKVFKIDKFTKPVTVPVIVLNKNYVESANKVLKKYIIKLNNFKPIRNGSNDSECVFYLDPAKFSSCEDLNLTFISTKNLKYVQIEVGYNNWNHDEILKAVLPEKSMLSSYSAIGSIIHVNLKPELLDYKDIIGRVLSDKLKGCKSVVNKIDNINNVYRNFEYEIIYGSSDLKTTIKENKCLFDLDFSEVYWNPRLCTEHERILQKLKSGDILYDVFAGIGPFSVPAAKLGCIVLANDLNPNSCKWLEINKKKNRIKDELLTIINKDGSKFIQEDLKTHYISWSKTITSENKIHVTMNLPAIAVDFIKYFNNLFEWEEISDNSLPILHVYTFVKTDKNYEEGLKSIMEEYFSNVNNDDIQEIIRVRNVAPNKEMVRITFQMRKDIICKSESIKKRKLNEIKIDDSVKKNKEDS